MTDGMIEQYGLRIVHGTAASTEAISQALAAAGVEVVSVQYQGFAPVTYEVRFEWDNPRVADHLKGGESMTHVQISSAIQGPDMEGALCNEIHRLFEHREVTKILGYTRI